MKTQNKYLLIPLIFFLQFFHSCSSDEAVDEVTIMPEPVYTVTDLDTTIEENPEDGNVLGSLSTNLPGSLTYTSSNPAFSFDTASREVTVADKAVFDYESNTTLTGTITISNGKDSVTSIITITLTDFVDAIEALLTTSKETYTNAASGDWIEITKDEFETLETNIEAISYSGLAGDLYPEEVSSHGAFNPSSGTGVTVANQTDAVMPAGSYLFAFRSHIGSGIFTKTEANKLKISEESNSQGFVDIGLPLPQQQELVQEVFFVLKGNLIPTENPAYLALFIKGGNGIGLNKIDDAVYWLDSNDSSNLRREGMGNRYAYQGLSTTKLQWE